MKLGADMKREMSRPDSVNSVQKRLTDVSRWAGDKEGNVKA